MEKSIVDNKIIKEFAEPELIDSMKTLLGSDKEDKLVAAALVVAKQFGGDKSFTQLLASEPNSESGQKLVKSFHNNLNLLVQKTWVEKSDEAVKEQILFRLENLCKDIYDKPSYEDFVVLLKDVVCLMFGSQAKSADFAEYALRIDPGFGIFWWYLQAIPEKAPSSQKKVRIFFLLGMLFLANY